MVCLFKRNGRKIYGRQNWSSLEHFCPIFFSFKSKAWKFSLVFLKVKDHPNIGKRRRRKVTQKLRDDGVDLKWHGRWTGCLFFLCRTPFWLPKCVRNLWQGFPLAICDIINFLNGLKTRWAVPNGWTDYYYPIPAAARLYLRVPNWPQHGQHLPQSCTTTQI